MPHNDIALPSGDDVLELTYEESHTRDKFAKHFAKVILNSSDTQAESRERNSDYDAWCDDIAESAYQMADAMIRARRRPTLRRNAPVKGD